MFNFLKRKKNNDVSSFISDLVDKRISEEGIEAVADSVSSGIENVIEADGIEGAASLYAKVISQQYIPSYEVALQFTLQELDGARQGNEFAVNFVNNSGFERHEYVGALEASFEEVTGPRGPQTMLDATIMSIRNTNHRAELRIAIVDEIMNIWKLGKYS
jgi:hypothetical protein